MNSLVDFATPTTRAQEELKYSGLEIATGALPGPPAPAGESETYREYVTRVAPKFRWYRHNEEAAEVLQAVNDGELDRVMFWLPPRHGKTEQVSRLFPAYTIDQHPERTVGLTAYGARLAYGFSRSARDYYLEGGGRIREDASSVQEWVAPEGGGMWADGVGGALTGRGFDVGIIDDPLKNREEAESELIRQKQIEWYDSTFYTRREPGAAIVIVLTRWHAKDLAGHLLKRSKSDGDSWYVVALDAVHEKRTYSIPASCVQRPDWREEGEPLCPQRYDLDDLQRTEDNSTDYEWSSLYQQRPTAREGNRFKRAWFENPENRVDQWPRGKRIRWIRSWDEGASPDDGDYTSGTLMGRDFSPGGKYYVAHVRRGQWSSGKRDKVQRAQAETDGVDVIQHVQQEPGSSGKDRARAFVRLMEGFPAWFSTVTGDKEIRADPYASQLEVGNVVIVDDGTWDVEAFIDEHLSFPRGANDDQVDSTAEAFNKLANMKPPQDLDGWIGHS